MRKVRGAVAGGGWRVAGGGRRVASGGWLMVGANVLVPWVRVMRVLPHLRTEKTLGALMSYHSFLRNGSTAFFLPPFFDFVNRLFFPWWVGRERIGEPGGRGRGRGSAWRRAAARGPPCVCLSAHVRLAPMVAPPRPAIGGTARVQHRF